MLCIVCFSTYAKSINTIATDSTVVIDNNIIYKVVQDPHNFFIAIETDERKASKTILREGITVYFDIKGKRKKNVFVRYPNKVSKPTGRRQQRVDRNTEEDDSNRNITIENLPKEAFYNYFNTQHEFHILLNDLNIDVTLNALEHNRIKYSLKIPKHKINDNPKKDLSKLTIGVLIGRDRTDETNNEQRQGGGQSGMQMSGSSQGGGRGNRGGGMSGGGGRSGGGMSGGGNGGGQRPSQENRTQATAFWFEVNPN